MKIASMIGRLGTVSRAAACVAGGIAFALASGVLAAQPDGATTDAPKGVNQPTASGKFRTLTVEVLRTDGDGKGQRHAVGDALVHITGSEDWQPTNDKGRTKLSQISSDKVTLQIKAIGADICMLDVAVTGSDQVVSVLVEKSQKCKRLE